MAEGVDLTPEQTEKLLQFQDLTGIEEIDRCKEILQTHNWDLEVAVQARFGEQEGGVNVYQQAAEENHRRPEPRTPPINTHPLDQRVYTISSPRPVGVFGWGYFIILFPFRFVYSTIVDIFRFAYRLLRPDPRRYITDPAGDVHSFILQFIETYGETNPDFFDGTYSQALNRAKQDLRFLLVYLHGDDHQDTPDFCRTTLCNPELVEFLESHVLTWGCSTNKPEGYRVSQALRENTYPFLALIVLRQNRMTVVARIEGPIGPRELMERLNHIIQENEASLIAARAEREERSFNQSLREEQDAAYLESLRADQEKERKKREEEEKKEREEQEARDKELHEQRLQEELARKKEELRNALPQEPDADDPDAIKILLKLPSGVRLERRFLKTDSLKHLHHYVLVHEAAPDDFQIVTNFPRKVLPTEPTDTHPQPPSFEEVGLGKSELLFVHDNKA